MQSEENDNNINGYENTPLNPIPEEPSRKISADGKKTYKVTALSMVLLILISCLSGAAGGYLGSKYLNKDSDAEGTSLSYQSVIRNVSDISEADEAMSVREVSALVADSVVEIRTEVVSTMWMTQYVTEGAGSGVIISDDGYIATNNHVIDGASKITVTLHNGESYEATLVATDEQTDLSVIKIEADGLSPVTFGSSSALATGEEIVVVGNPLGELGGSVSWGIISALDREITIDSQSMTLLQTDAAVNPGNSGGGMFNMYGELVGIVNAKGSGSEIDNIGFAIPVDVAKNVIEQLIETGYVTGRAYLGITMVDILNERTASSYRVSDLGVYIYNINEDTNAYRAGLRAGDMIAAINDSEISSSGDVTEKLQTLTPGEEITITIKRNGTEKDCKFVLEEYVPK